MAECEAVAEAALADFTVLEVADRGFDPAGGLFEAVVVNDQSSFITKLVGVGEDVLVDRPFRGVDIVQEEVSTSAKAAAFS